MNITPTRSEGLQREWSITIPAADLSRRLDARLETLRAKTKLRGFRPGKVPASHLRRLYGRSLMREIVQTAMQETGEKILADENLRPAEEPRFTLDESAMPGGMEAVEKGECDLACRFALEVIPEIDLGDFSRLSLVRPTTEITAEDVERALERIAHQNRKFEPKDAEDATAEPGDRIRLDFDGSIDGAPFADSRREDVFMEIPAAPDNNAEGEDAADTSIAGFAHALRGRNKGESEVDIDFPADHPLPEFAGKQARFAVTIKEIAAPHTPALDDAFAAALGAENLDALRKQISQAIAAEDARAARAKLKRQLLDQLARQYDFALPNGMVARESAAIQSQLAPPPAEGEPADAPSEEDDALAREYASIAERRVRLALLMSEIGRRNNIEVTPDELSRAVAVQAQRMPQKEQAKLYAYYRDNPRALETIRAPIFEDKVTDFLFELARIEEREVTRETLYSDADFPAEEEADAAPSKKKPAKKKTAPPKKKK